MGGGAVGCESGKTAWGYPSVNGNEPRKKRLKEATDRSLLAYMQSLILVLCRVCIVHDYFLMKN